MTTKKKTHKKTQKKSLSRNGKPVAGGQKRKMDYEAKKSGSSPTRVKVRETE
jgi:hypothetical protein